MLEQFLGFIKNNNKSRRAANENPPPQFTSDDPVSEDTRLSGWFDEDNQELFTGFKISEYDKILDVGCGDGSHSLFCGRLGAAVVFADIDAARVDALAKRFNDYGLHHCEGLVTDTAPLPIKDCTFDKVIATEVLEHVDDPRSFMEELVRVGKPGAQYLLAVPGEASESVQQVLAPPAYFEKPNHIRIFRAQQFEDLVKTSGLIVESQHTYGFYHSIWWSLFWTCDHDLSEPWHPLLHQWTDLWKNILNSRDGAKIKRALDRALPKSQVLVARKPREEEGKSASQP